MNINQNKIDESKEINEESNLNWNNNYMELKQEQENANDNNNDMEKK